MDKHVELTAYNGVKTLVVGMVPPPRGCFTMEFLDEMLEARDIIAKTVTKDSSKYRYQVLKSNHPKVFSTGGDLESFLHWIENEPEALELYTMKCLNLAHSNYCGYNMGVKTIALVQGDALGGGFECALSNQVIFAEERARFSFPEPTFGMFPGMGAISFLLRRIGKVATLDMIASRKTYTAAELYAMGAIDAVVENGLGEEKVSDYIARDLVQRAADRWSPREVPQAFDVATHITAAELYEIGDLWVQRSLKLSERDKGLMRRIVAAQSATG